jgi:hypothetical protein
MTDSTIFATIIELLDARSKCEPYKCVLCGDKTSGAIYLNCLINHSLTICQSCADVLKRIP